MKQLILVLLSVFVLSGCMDFYLMERERKNTLKKYPECSDLSTPGATQECKQALVQKEGKER